MPISGGLLGTGGLAFTVIVQADLSGTAFGSAPTWTDITRFVRLGPSPINITKWRQDQLSDVAPSTMTLVLDNMDVPGDATAPNAGRFTPFLTSSPWTPHILPGVRIRAGVTVNAVTYWRFDGYVDTWDASYEDGEFGICTVSASDILARLGAVDALRTMYVEECLADSPVALYPLTEPAGALAAGDISAAAAPALTIGQIGGGDVTFAAATGIPTDGSSTATMNETLSVATTAADRSGDYLASAAFLWPTVNMTIEAVVTLHPDLATVMGRNSGSVLIAAQHNRLGDTPYGLFLQYDAGAIRLQNRFGPFTAVGPDLNDGHLHHLAVVNDSGANTTTYYVDGVVVATAANSFTRNGRFAMAVGNANPSETGLATLPNPSFRGGVGYVAGYSAALSAARIAAHNTAARTAFVGEGTSTHLSRLLTYRTNLGATLDTGQGTVSVHEFAGDTEQQALLDTVKAEGGLLYVDGTGKVVFLDRTHLRNPPSVLTLDITAQQTGDDLNVRADRDLLLNDVTISRPGGATQRKTDQTSKNTYGVKGLSETRIIGTDADGANAAGWLVGNGKDVRARTPALSVDLLTEPSLTVAAGVLNLVPLQRVTLSNPPTSMAASDVVVQGCTDTIGVDVFSCAFNVSPLPRPTLRFDAAADSFTKLDSGNVFAW